MVIVSCNRAKFQKNSFDKLDKFSIVISGISYIRDIIIDLVLIRTYIFVIIVVVFVVGVVVFTF